MAELLPTAPPGSMGFHRRLLVATAAALAVAMVPAVAPTPAPDVPPAPTRVSVIIRELPGAGRGPELLVKELGGTVVRHIRIIDGFTAEVPAAALDELRSFGAIYTVTRNQRVELLGAGEYDPATGR
jgi:hypothetical protein